MCKGALYSKNDMPYCPTTAKELPKELITWEVAKHMYKKAIARKETSFYCDAFICFYTDDYRFDGIKGIWHNKVAVLRVMRHFAGAITPDFSTFLDFPDPLKRYNTYRMRLFGYWLGENGIKVINNVRWGREETWEYCWDGIPYNSIVAIGTVASGLRKLENRAVFDRGIREMVQILRPQAILVYGSDKRSVFDEVRAQGIIVKAFPSRTAELFARRERDE